jgi:hypothetical protein
MHALVELTLRELQISSASLPWTILPSHAFSGAERRCRSLSCFASRVLYVRLCFLLITNHTSASFLKTPPFAQAYLEAYSDASLDDISAVAKKSYENGNKNPKAHMHTKIFKEGGLFLSNPEYKPYLRSSDCSQVSDGGAIPCLPFLDFTSVRSALLVFRYFKSLRFFTFRLRLFFRFQGAAAIFMSEGALKKHGVPLDAVVEVIGMDQGAGDLWQEPEEMCELSTVKTVVSRMMRKAGVRPSDLEVVEVHDCFAVTELMMYEAIGLVGKGQGAEFFRSGATQVCVAHKSSIFHLWPFVICCLPPLPPLPPPSTDILYFCALGCVHGRSMERCL